MINDNVMLIEFSKTQVNRTKWQINNQKYYERNGKAQEKVEMRGKG